ncbi:helix-turn-helix domain-containing protein, partial [Thorsellia anophelis]
MSYNHLSLEERHYINTALKKEISISQIAKDLERSQSTISREVNRNKGHRGYRYKQANSKALQRHKDKHKHVKLTV